MSADVERMQDLMTTNSLYSLAGGRKLLSVAPMMGWFDIRI